MENHQLIDTATAANDTVHTWYRKGNQQSSRLDMILTSIPMDNLRFKATLTIFDHANVSATFGQLPSRTTPIMKDFILGTDEYLIRSEDTIQAFLDRFGTHRQQADQHDNQQEPPHPAASKRDENIDVSNPTEGRTALHVFNNLIHELQSIHNDISKRRNEQQRLKVRLTSSRLFQLRNQLKRTRNPEGLAEIHQELNDLQRTLANDLEVKEQAAQMRISNFTRTNRGKMVPETFYCIKERNISKKIHKLEHEGRTITNQEEIIQIMQQWYEQTASRSLPQTMNLPEFLLAQNIILPQISEEHKEMLQEEFTMEEVLEAINDANSVSAPGPTGQNITFYRLLFLEIPNIMTQALNELVYMPELGDLPRFRWIRHRKVVYIPKKPSPTTPSDYRPLSMLEVLYKIPSRILAGRLTRILPTVIGPHQHGFMAKKGIQEPSILATHLIQEATKYRKPLQLVSFDIEKAFDRVSHNIIVDALRAFGVPEITINALRHYTLVGHAYVEVNGKRGLVITIKTGSGQGDPLSSILFLIATEPLNRALAANFPEIMYTTEGGTKVGPILFADDNLNPLSIPNEEGLQEYLQTYESYRRVSGLNINIRKTEALCINTPQEIQDLMHRLGINTPPSLKHLGLHLATTIEGTIACTMTNIEPKAIKRRIFATTPPTDLLHRATLINTALTPIYNHVFMALPTTREQGESLYQETLSFLWTRQVDGETKQKRRLIAKNRIAASHSMGGLQIQHPMEHAKSLRLNLIQRIWTAGGNNPFHSKLPLILQETLTAIRRPTLAHHIQYMGPAQWDTTGEKLKSHNLLFSQAFQSMAHFLRTYENHEKDWPEAAIYGHTMMQNPVTFMEHQELETLGIVTVSQLYETQENGQITNQNNIRLFAQLLQTHPNLYLKLQSLTHLLRHKRRRDVFPLGITTAHCQIQKDRKLSSEYRKRSREEIDKGIRVPPAYSTRERDGVYHPGEQTFIKAYDITDNKDIPSKTKEVSFQILNRTIWTNSKAFKSGLEDSDSCMHCEDTETMEHLLLQCENYSALIWQEYSSLITAVLKEHSGHQDIPRMDHYPLHIIFNVQHPSILLHVTNDRSRRVLIHLTQEIKRDIIYRRMNTTGNGNPVPLPRIHAHLLSTITKLKALLEYQGLTDQSDPMKLMRTFQEKLHDMIL